MKHLLRSTLTCLLAAVLTLPALADGRKPGSLLVFPMHRSGPKFFTVVSVTNINTDPATQVSLGGSTNILFEYVNTIHDRDNPQLPIDCFVIDRTEHLTPADTLASLTRCHNAVGGNEGYLVVTATDPSLFKTPWSFDHLLGSALCVSGQGGAFSFNAIPFSTEAVAPRAKTDLDLDGMRDFDGVEYEGIPRDLFIDSFISVAGSSLTLVNMTGGTKFTTVVRFDVWNDNEFPLSSTALFRCWFEESLADVSLVFQDAFLRFNTPNDPQEIDINCDGVGDFEGGWARIRGLTADSLDQSIYDPALLGAITSGPIGPGVHGGRLLWESHDLQYNGKFLNFSVNDPEN